MKKITLSVCGALLVAAVAVRAAQDAPPAPKAEKEHAWLQQLLGEWESAGEIYMEPGKPPVKSKGTETAKSVGEFWTMAENKGEFMGAAFTGVLTLGYNPDKKKYIGTWVDSMSNFLWTYEGTLDAAGKTLTLNAEGPGPNPAKLVKYKDVWEIKDKDTKVLTSHMERDGKWVALLTITYTRKK